MEIGGSGPHSGRQTRNSSVFLRLVADGSCWLVTSGFQDARAQCCQHFKQHWTLAVAAVGYVLGNLALWQGLPGRLSCHRPASRHHVLEAMFLRGPSEKSFEEASLCKSSLCVKPSLSEGPSPCRSTCIM